MAKNAIAKGALAEAMLIGSDEVAEGALEAFRETEASCPQGCSCYHLSGYSNA